MNQHTIPLNQLRFGHEATPPINARKVGREEDITSLAASIEAHGLGQALSVRMIDGVAYVADGNRRLAALRLNAERGLLPADWLVKVDDSIEGDAGEISLALNIERVPMHEADQYEKFCELQRAGMTEEQISARFGIEAARVRRMLALGALSPIILDAWRDGEFGRDSVEIVRAFTLAANVADQERAYEKLKKAERLHGNLIRQEFGSDRNSGALVALVGIDAYKAAGGFVTEDLFGENHVVSDAALLRSMADEKLASTRQALLDDGWSWVEFYDALPYSWTYSWQKLSLAKTTATAEQKAAAGCVIRFDFNSHLEITYGVIKPKPAKAEKKSADAPAVPALISNAVMQRLSVQLTAAAKQAITANPKTALAAVVAGLVTRTAYGGIPVRVCAEGMLKEGRDKPDFAQLFSGLLDKSVDELLDALAIEAGFMLDMHSHTNTNPPLGNSVNRVFVEALEADILQTALRDRFDAEDYFKSVPKSFTLAAIREAIGDDQAQKAEKLKKGEIVALALANIPKTGWLPPELRTARYAGPRAKAKPTRKLRTKKAAEQVTA